MAAGVACDKHDEDWIDVQAKKLADACPDMLGDLLKLAGR